MVVPCIGSMAVVSVLLGEVFLQRYPSTADLAADAIEGGWPEEPLTGVGLV